MESSRSVIHAKDLKIGYSEKIVLGRIEKLDIQQGEIVSIIGESGIGKTTFLKTIANLVKPLGAVSYTHLTLPTNREV